MPLQTHHRSRESSRLAIDLPAMAATFGHRLHDADLPVTPAQSQQFALSLALTRPTSLRRLYFTTRAVFVTEPEQTETFDRVFEEVFQARIGIDADHELTIVHTLRSRA